ncbi:TPA: glycosyl transferase [Candidatus Uhrbacteria bacterium]|nr:glycosyl transferase [Candidatus Uhrbacteria bacterium]
MRLKKWESIPEFMKNMAVKDYYDSLKKKELGLILKRIFDIVFSIVGLLILTPLFILIAILIKLSSKGPIFFLQTRITQFGRQFKIIKFRTMVTHAEELGLLVTSNHDSRITKFGSLLRKFRIDEIPQLFNILIGDMSFVGTRPEVLKYVNCYSDEMYATLLLPAGVTSKTSIEYKNETELLNETQDPEKTYIEVILPQKMKINLSSLQKFSFFDDIVTIIRTVINVFFG